jgi:hypothetical protein
MKAYVGVLISLWLFLFAAQQQKIFLYGLKKSEQRSHKCVWSSGGKYVEYIYFFQSRSLLFSLYSQRLMSRPPSYSFSLYDPRRQKKVFFISCLIFFCLILFILFYLFLVSLLSFTHSFSSISRLSELCIHGQKGLYIYISHPDFFTV